MTDESGRHDKKIYESPKITIISLRPEEAVLGHCKASTASGPVAAGCTSGIACNALGS